QEAPAGDHDIAHRLIVLVGADDLDVLLLAADQDAVEVGHHSGGGDNVGGQFLADGLHIRHFDIVRLGDGAAARRGVIGKNDVGPDALHLFQDVVPAGQGNGHDEDYRGRADGHSQASEQGTDGTGAKRLPAKPDRYAKE